MYVITYHRGDYDEVLLGPIAWKPKYIASVIQDDLDLEKAPNIAVSDEMRVPYDILPNIRVRPVTEIYEPINLKIQRYEGPFWSYTEDLATATWIAVDKSIEHVKGELKNIVSSARYKKENNGIKLTIKDTEIYCDTSRENRNLFFEKHLTMKDNETTNWKFINVWLELNKEEMKYIITEVLSYTQTCFDWENQKHGEIDVCLTLEELDAIVIEEE